MIKRIFARITDGRPMTITSTGFVDKITGKPVNYYVDMFGRRWMANSRWALSRVRVSDLPVANPYATSTDWDQQ